MYSSRVRIKEIIIAITRQYLSPAPAFLYRFSREVRFFRKKAGCPGAAQRAAETGTSGGK
jgi:hypothetical protein